MTVGNVEESQMNHYRIAAATVGLALAILAGCRPPEAMPSQDRDLGDAGRPLLPTGMTWANPDVATGTAQWQELREPSFGEAGQAAKADDNGNQPASDQPAGTEPEEAKALRSLITDYNATLDDAAYDDLPGFFVSSQVDAVKNLIRVLPQVVTKLTALNAALPKADAELATAIDALNPAKLLHVELGPVKSESDTAASAPLKNVPDVAPLKFAMEDGEWYIEHPIVAAVSPALGQLEQGLTSLDETITGLKDGTLDEATVKDRVAAARAMIAAFWQPAVQEKPQDEAGGAAKADKSVGT